MASYQKYVQIGLALDPIHVGAGGARIGRVDLTIVRDPVIQVPKIPGSSLAGVYRTYVAMAEQEANPNRQINGQAKPYYPDCAGLGQPRADGTGGHCGRHDCPVCTVFGFAKGKDQSGGFAGLASFSDAHVLLFPVPTRRGPHWVTSPTALRLVGIELTGVDENAVYLETASQNKLNLGWLFLDVKPCGQLNQLTTSLQGLGIPDYIRNRLALLPDGLFVHVVNNNLEVRTSVSINPETGAAEEGLLFSYEALPRSTVLLWEIVAKNPAHFRMNGNQITAVQDPNSVHDVTKHAHPYLEHLGLGGMGTRGMGRVKVVYENQFAPSVQQVDCAQAAATQGTQP